MGRPPPELDEIGLALWRQLWEDDGVSALRDWPISSSSPLPLLVFSHPLGFRRAGAALRWTLRYIARLSPSDDVTGLDQRHAERDHRVAERRQVYLSLIAAVGARRVMRVSAHAQPGVRLRETRPWWKRGWSPSSLTVSLRGLIIAALALILYGGAISDRIAGRLGIGSLLLATWHLLRWPVVAVFLVIPFEMVYNYAPNLGESPNRQWGTPGAVTGVVLFLGVSAGFRIYLEYFKSYTTAYGSLGAVILMLLWFYLTAFAIIMGGEVNSEIAREISARKKAAQP